MSNNHFDNKLISFNKKITSDKTKYLELQKKLNCLTTKNYNFLIGRIYFVSDDVSQNIFVYQPALDMLELKKDKGTDYVLSLRSKGVYTSKIKPLYNAFLQSRKLSGYRMRINFDRDPLAVEQNNYATKIVNACIGYDLDARPRNPTNNVKFEDCLFGTPNIVKSSDNEKCVYSGYRIRFDGACL